MELTIAKKKYYDMIKNIVSFNKISHAYIIEINDYDTDFKCVIDFVKLILNDDKVSALIDKNSYPDLKIIEPDGSIIRKSQVIKLQEEFRNKSFFDNKMIYIIKEAEKLNDSSANTILKFLEEPEENIVAILVTTNRYKVIETILSRCQVLSLQESDYNVDVSDNVIDFIRFLVNKDDLFINYQYILNNILIDKDVAKALLNDVEFVLINYLNCIYNDCQIHYDEKLVASLSKLDDIRITQIIAIIEEEVGKLEYNLNYKLWLDCLFARLR